ncbi:Hypothetical predicted protein, partial [Pelobates cultripes]
EQLMRASRNANMPDPYGHIKIFADLSAETLQFRKNLTPITTTLREQKFVYRWGYPAKLLVHHGGTLHAIFTLDMGLSKLKDWGFQVPERSQQKPAKVPRISPEHCVSHPPPDG